MNIYDSIKANEIEAYYKVGVDERIPYLGETLFPAKKEAGLELRWIKGSGGLPVALKPSAYDSETRLRDRVGFEELTLDMPYFKEGFLIKERDRQELNKLQNSSGNEGYKDLILGKIFDDAMELVRGARVQGERLCMQLLSTGKIDIQANKLDYQYDYQMKEGNKETLLTTDRWSDLEKSNPLEDIERWLDAMEDETGDRPTKAICTKKTYNYIKQNKNVKVALKETLVTDNMVNELVSDYLGISIATYNKRFKSEAGVTTKLFPDDVFTLIPDGTLGNLHFGMTPEESDGLAGTDANLSVVNTGVAITTVKRVDPVNIFTKASAVMIPSFEQIDSVFIANVNG